MADASAEVPAVLSEAGFEALGVCDATLLDCRTEVRDMCSANKCHMYGRNWACPPACGPLGGFQEAFGERGTCYVVQTVRKLRHEFDGHGMIDAGKVHKERMQAVADGLREGGIDVLVLSAGACELCPECAYPEPCRFPERRLVSMEAAGLVVYDVCKLAGVPYDHGELTIAYTGAVLV